MFENMNSFRQSMQSIFADCPDYICRQLSLCGADAVVLTIRELADKEYIADSVIRPMLEKNDWSGFRGDFCAVLRSSKIAEGGNADDIASALISGSAVVAVMTDRLYIAVISADSYFGRSVSEPSTDVTVKGSKSAFVEDIEKNIAMLRKIVRTPKLKYIDYTLGSETETRVSLMYIEGRADMRTLERAKKMLLSVSPTVITDSASVELITKERRWGIFPSTGSTEKIEKAASLLVAGRCLLICDGSPFVLTLPYVFIEAFQSSEDYVRTPYYATFVRFLRFFAFLLALYLPALCLILVEYHPDALPSDVYGVIDRLRADIPISLFDELLIMLVMFEVIREVGLRMPRSVGDAVGIVGSIIIGDAATKAGIASTTVILVVAVSAVCNFVVPMFSNQTVLLRFLFLFFAAAWDFYGLIGGSVLLFILLCTKRSYGVWYMKPIMPFSASGMLDFLIAVPQITVGKKENLR